MRGARALVLLSALALLPALSACRDQAKDGPKRLEAKAEALGPTQQDPAELLRPDGTMFAEAEMMGTRVSINVWVGEGGDAAKAQAAIKQAMFEMARIEHIASEWKADTDLSKLNRKAGAGPQRVAPELVEILAKAKQISADTEGLFDVSFHAVGQLWSFSQGAEPPSREAVAERLPKVDWTKIELDAGANTAALAEPGMAVGLGAIAKGYAVDRAAALLREQGFDNFIVEAGGDTYVSGRKGPKPWRVGVQDPKDPRGRVGNLPASDEAVVTSGNYARYFVWEGVHYTHILDPRTGWPIPAERSPKSVTLVAEDAATADAYCTAVSVMKPEQGMAFVEARPALEAVIITPQDEVLVSSGLRDRYVDERPEAERPEAEAAEEAERAAEAPAPQ